MEKLEKINFIVKGDSLLNEETVILDSLTKLNELQDTYLSEDGIYSKYIYGYLSDHRTSKEFFLYSDATKQKYNFTKDYILSSTTAKNVGKSHQRFSKGEPTSGDQLLQTFPSSGWTVQPA